MNKFRNPLTIIVVGTMASDPYAGMAWMNMQLTAGFKKLGHRVYYFEVTSTWPHHPVLHMRVDNTDYAIPYIQRITERFGLKDHWAFRCSFSKNKEWLGLTKQKAEELLANADLVFNVSAATRFAEEGLKTKRLVYYGTDPVYHEIKYSQKDPVTISIVDEHTDVVTFGENIGNPDCPIPALPKLKAKTRQPVLMEYWDNDVNPGNKFTTVGNWKQGGRDLTFNGEIYYWSKHHEFLKFLDLPKKINQPIELAMNLAKPETIKHGRGTEVPALGVAANEYDLLIDNGWLLTDAPSFTMDPWPYRDYIIQSKGEFTFAKDQNIRLKSGWFSERSACYLAAGRPVITQDTSFGCCIPTGEGLFSFSTEEDILNAFDKINNNYQKHQKAAKEIAATHFNSDIVLDKLLSDLGY